MNIVIESAENGPELDINREKLDNCREESKLGLPLDADKKSDHSHNFSNCGGCDEDSDNDFG